MKKLIFPAIYFQKPERLFFFLSIVLLINSHSYAQGDLLIYPKRLTFEGTQNRVQILNLNNRGKDTTTYKLSYLENRMHADGKFEIIEEPDAGQLFASPYLRFYPRTITLAPNETQVVKVQLVKTGELTTGEYRSHLYLRPVPKNSPQENKNNPGNSEGVSLELKPVYGISIANIIRIGEPESKIDISNLSFKKFNDSIPIISMDFIRAGNSSSYGDIQVHHISPTGKKTTVGEMNGFAVYTPGNLRHARMKLKPEGVDYNKGELTVSYLSQGPASILYAEGILQL